MGHVPDQGAVEQFSAAVSDPPLHDRVHARHTDLALDCADAFDRELGVEALMEQCVAVVQIERDLRLRVVEVH